MKNKMGGSCGTKGEQRNAYKVLVVKPERKRPFGRPRRGWEDMKIDFKETELKGGNRHVAGSGEQGNETSGCIKCGEFLDWVRNCTRLKKDSVPRANSVIYKLVFPPADLAAYG